MSLKARLIAALVTLVCWGLSMALCAWWFYGAGADSQIAKQSEIKDAIQQTQAKAETGAANAIAKAAAENTKTITRVQTITREVPVYRDSACSHDQRVFDDINAALRGSPAGGGIVPGGSGGVARQADGIEH